MTSKPFAPEPSDVYCVPLLVAAAIQDLEGHRPDLGTLARALDVRVRQDSQDPWGLKRADSRHPPGVTMSALQKLLPAWLAGGGAEEITYSYRPIDTSRWEDPELVYRDLVHDDTHRTFVGAALDWSVLSEAPKGSLHVVEVLSYRGSVASIRDHSFSRTDVYTLPINTFEAAMYEAQGGLLVFRKANQ